jgi:hypothetical protein
MNNINYATEMQKIIKEAHVLTYGDVLVSFLKLFLEMFKVHSHSFPRLPTILPLGYQEFFNYNLDNILSKNVRIN